MFRVFCESVNIPPPNLRELGSLANNFPGLIFRAHCSSLLFCRAANLQMELFFGHFFFFFLFSVASAISKEFPKRLDFDSFFLILQKEE